MDLATWTFYGTVVLTNGVFDLLHTGHLYYLQKARSLGGALFIALNADASVRALKGPARPVQTEEQRAYALAAEASMAPGPGGTPLRMPIEVRQVMFEINPKD